MITVIPDLHIGLVWDGCDRTPDVFDFLEQAKEYVSNRDVVFLGDVFNDPNVSHKHIARFIEVLHEYKAAGAKELYILRGNHDGEVSLKRGSPLQEVAATGICSVIWEPTLVDKFLFLPYTIDPIPELDVPPDTIAFSHLDIENAIAGLEKDIGRGLDSFLPEWVSKKCLQVFGGHIHHRQRHGNIELVGAAIRVKTSESTEISGILQVSPDGSFKRVVLSSRCLMGYKLTFGNEECRTVLKSLLDNDISTAIVSMHVTCPHTEAHKFDFIKYEDTIRKKCHYLRFVLDVVKEKELRIKELDDTKSDIEIAKLYIGKQSISDEKEVLECVNETME